MRHAGKGWRLGLVVGAALLLGACSRPSNTPSSYDETVQSNFVEACQGTGPGTSVPTTLLASADFCGCAYDVVVANVPYNEDDKKNRDGGQTFANYDGPTFLEIDKDLQGNPSGFPASVTDEINAQCGSERVTPVTEAPAGGGTSPGTEGTSPGTSAG